jgi:c-di-GMP-binding flagellar brake protein YcgR
MLKGGFMEKRKYRRLDCSMPAHYRKIGKIESEDNNALTRNVSEGGVRIVVDEYIPANTRLALVLSFPFKNKKIRTFSKVVWSKRHSIITRYDLGIQFIDITSNARKNLADFIKRKSS